ncbi:MAG: RHS repeat-associated core domain-containing protein [Flavobacteriaceae bacterium]|nr:RHS repeat-associated core domain-containing protein [Flavobacteriaceae bacterium]
MYVETATVTVDTGVTLDPGAEIVPYEVTTDFLDLWAFQYRYDERNRMVEKKVPGSGWVYMVYDKLDRLVLTQDANQRDIDQWTFSKYDELSRPVLTGFYTSSSSRSALQTTVNSQTYLYEEFGSGSIQGYTNQAFPNVSSLNDYLSISFYDAYTSAVLSLFPYVQEIGLPSTYSSNTKGRAVASMTKVLGSTTWIKSLMYYDDKGRVIQTHSDNHIGGEDRTSSLYDFAGRVLETKTSHNDGTTTTTVAEEYTYDHASRLLQVDHQVNTDDAVILIKNEYNAIGELIDKKLHSTNSGSTFEQSVDYSYNIRGWLQSINDAALSDSEGDYFGMQLAYNDNTGGVTNPMYNGNISGTIWSQYSHGDGVQAAYAYEYDAMNRLIEADYVSFDGGFSNPVTFDVNGIDYDLNGNIRDLIRYGTSTTLAMDLMEYLYDGNQLRGVNDYGNQSQGFVDGYTGSIDYTYDDNGNMISDANKDITAISYNHLNLPQTVTFTGSRSITYTYDAAGIKLAKSVNNNGSTTVTDYVGGFIYEDGDLQQLAHAEGRVRKKDNNDFVYDYYLKDHLGNTRVTFTTENEEVVYLATMETAHSTFEEAVFLNVDMRETNSTANKTVDVTTNEDQVIRLRGNDTNRQLGVSKLLQVMRGDEVDMEVYAYHFGGYSDNGSVSNTAILSALVAGVTGSAPNGLETAGVSPAVNGNASAIFVGSNGSSTSPRAYLNYILFDSDFNYLDAGFAQATNTANSHLQLTLSKTIEESGFIYVYTSNESNTGHDVYFDDFRITHTKGRVMQEDHYYPFGLSIGTLSSTAPLSKPNQFKYNGKELDGEFDIDWYSYGARNYDPQIARWFNVDPLAEKYLEYSTYGYVVNNPIIFIDPDGREIIVGNSRSKTISNLAQIVATSEGRRRVDRLIRSSNTYHTRSVYWTRNSAYDGRGTNGDPRTIYFVRSSLYPTLNGGANSSAYIMGHEIDHAYNHEVTGRSGEGERESREYSAVMVGNNMRSVYGEEKMRTRYSGTRLTFSDNPDHYNRKNESVTGFTTEFESNVGGVAASGFSYMKSENGEEAKKMYQIGLVNEDGKYIYRIFDNKDDYDAAVKRVQEYQNNREKDENN